MRCILVYGLESGGTSCVAGILHKIGIHMGDSFPKEPYPEKVKPGVPTPYRYEDSDFVKNVYGDLEAWASRRIGAGKEIWGIKSPLLVPMNDHVIPIIRKKKPDIEIRIVVVARKIDSVVKSAKVKRPPEKAEMVEKNVRSSMNSLWNVMAKLAPKYNTFFIDYDELVDHTEGEVVELIDFCFEGMGKPSGKQIADAIDFVQPHLRHSK